MDKNLNLKNNIAMAKFLSRVIAKIGNLLIKISKIIYRPLQEKRTLKWFQINGDKTLRLDYDLNESSIVFDVGGYEGQWASDIAAKFNCFVWVFEPVKEFANKITKRFQKNSKIKVLGYGLAGKDQEVEISLSSDSSSVYKKGDKTKIKLFDIVEFMKNNNIDHIDLLKLNIEGGEYEVLERLISSGMIGSVKNIQVQFHDFVPNAKNRMEKIQNDLGLTHKLTYQFEFVWENWERV